MSHKKCNSILLLIFLWAGSGLVATFAGEPVSGAITSYTSPNGLSEQCIEITPMPKAHYSKKDLRTQAEYCSIDFSKVALCPKLWSTSPGTIIYRIDAAKYNGDYTQFEKQHCAEGHHARAATIAKLASLKISVNHKDTSGTYAPSSWVYYHLSRYFKTGVQVPVAVYRSIDKQVHLDRVVRPALNIIHDRHGLKMLKAGWGFLDAVESGQDMGSAGRAMLTDNGRQVFGALLDNKGDRYGIDFNGTRESGWGEGQNFDFQQTAPYLALRSELPMAEAITQGIHHSRSNPKMASKISEDIAPAQVAFWMKELLEITLLDYVLGQQDRIGNIDYSWRWFWLQDGKLESKRAHGSEMPSDLAEFQPLRLRQSAINDNDAGVRRGYANFAMKTGMLEKLRHYNPHLYKRLAHLADDLRSEGVIYQWFVNSSGLGSKEIESIRERTLKAFALLQSDCKSGSLKLDLEPGEFLFDPNRKEVNKEHSCEAL